MAPQVFQRLRSSLSYLWLIALAGYLTVSAAQAMIRNYQSQQQIVTLQNQLSTLQQQKEHLNALLVYYNTDTYKEQVLRQDLLLAMPGERVYALPESGGTRSLDAEALASTASETSTAESGKSNLQQWVDYLF